MKTQVITALFTIATLFSANTFAGQNVTNTAEMNLIIQTATLSGKKLSTDQKRDEMARIMDQYNTSSSPVGRQERLSKALVQSGIMTPAGVVDFQNEIAQSMKEAVAQGRSIDVAAETATRSALSNLAGAQYSNCGTTITIGALAAVGFLYSIHEYANLTQNDYSYSDGYYDYNYHNGAADIYMLTTIASGIVLFMDMTGAFGDCN